MGGLLLVVVQFGLHDLALGHQAQVLLLLWPAVEEVVVVVVEELGEFGGRSRLVDIDRRISQRPLPSCAQAQRSPQGFYI